MNATEVKAIVLEELGKIAPEADCAALDPQAPLRDEMDIDSMDFLNFVIAIDERLQVAIPESDYGKLDSIANIVGYLTAKIAQ
ncbi:MAG: phosphopantetheine-binding protein [Kiloniellales bacterium]